jgi:hypothetical protein
MDIGEERQKVVAIMTAILLSGKTLGAGAKAHKDVDSAIETAHHIWDAVKWHESEQAKKLAAASAR